jgi:hypothetical protein
VGVHSSTSFSCALSRTHTQWTEAAVAASAPGASFAEQLTEKASRHSTLLSCLSESGVLHSLEPEVQVRLLLEVGGVESGVLGLDTERRCVRASPSRACCTASRQRCWWVQSGV